MESAGEDLPVVRPVILQLVLLSAAIALQVVGIVVLVKVLLQRRGQERHQLAEERQGLTAQPADGRSSVDIRDGEKESDTLRLSAEDPELEDSRWLPQRYRVVCCCCFGGFICCTSSASNAGAILHNTLATDGAHANWLACNRCRSNQHERRNRVDARAIWMGCCGRGASPRQLLLRL